jgi:hypothetical protein
MINSAPVRNRAIGARRMPRKRLAPEELIRQGSFVRRVPKDHSPQEADCVGLARRG